MTTQKRRSDRCGRARLRSPGRPPAARREDYQVFWASIAAGRTTEDAAVDAGVSPAVGGRWFRRAATVLEVKGEGCPQGPQIMGFLEGSRLWTCGQPCAPKRRDMAVSK
jgi:hypothetical protein